MEKLFHAGVSNAVSATFLALLVACVARPLARRPAVLHCLWFLVLLKLVTPPLYEVTIPWPASWAGGHDVSSSRQGDMLDEQDRSANIAVPPFPYDQIAEHGELDVIELDLESTLRSATLEVRSNDNPANGAIPIDLTRMAATIWIVGTVAILIVSTRRIRRFQRLLENAETASEADQDWVDAMAGRMGLRRGPVLEWIRGKLSPMIWSLGWRSRLIIPRELWKSLAERQRSTLVVHELAHLRRGDHFVRIFELVVTAFFWWHPVVWWVRHALRDAEEQCCDAWVVWAFPDAARSYAETLLEAIDFLNGSEKAEPLLASGFGKVSHLRRRLTMILTGSSSRLLGVRGVLGLLGMAALLLPVNATWAQKSEEPQKVDVVVKSIVDVINADDAANIKVHAISNPIQGHFVTSSDLVNFTTGELDGDEKNQFQLVVKTDDSPDIQVSGSLSQALEQLQKQIADIKKKSPRSEQDEKRSKALDNVLVELTKIAGQIKGAETRSDEPGKRRESKNMTIEARVDDSPKKPLTESQQAEINKARSRVKELSRELDAKAKELSEAQASLAKMEGSTRRARFIIRRVVETSDDGVATFLKSPVVNTDEHKKIVIQNRDIKINDIDDKSLKTVEVKKAVPVQRRVTVNVNPVEKGPVVGEIKKVEPKQRRVEFQIGSDDGLVPGHELKLFSNHPGMVKVPAEQQRIDELEKKLKELLDEVTKIKNEKSKSPSGK